MDWRTLTAWLRLLRYFPLLQVVNLVEAIAQAEQNILGVLAGDGANVVHLPRSVRQVDRDANLRNFPPGYLGRINFDHHAPVTRVGVGQCLFHGIHLAH